MDCAEFEQRLTSLAGDEVAEAERKFCLRALADHASRCQACGGSADLVRVLAQPPGRRLPVADPGDAYWQAFDDRVRQRIRLDGRVSRARAGGWAAVAAVLLLGLGGAWLWRSSEPGAVKDDSLDTTMELPRELVELLERASPADVGYQVEILAGLGSPWSAGAEDDEERDGGADLEDPGMFPYTDRLEPDARQELLDWLTEQESSRQGVS